ncbi:hypothetical protein JCM8097_004208 [Rhodosporidiobolus ruineniae]
MLDRLPLELVQHIVFLTLPSSSSFTKYRERQDPLLALCLTSRTLRAVAQPILFESVGLDNKEAVDTFLKVVEAKKVLGEHVQKLRLQKQRVWDAGFITTIDELVRPAPYVSACPHIVQIMLVGYRVAMDTLKGFSRLTRLSLVDCAVEAKPFTLPTLRELSLFLPALRVLHFQACEYRDEEDLNVSCLKALQPQLEAIACSSLDVWDHDSPFSPLLAHILLLDTGFEDVEDLVDLPIASSLRYLRLNPLVGEIDIDLFVVDPADVEANAAGLLVSLTGQLRDLSAYPSLSCIFVPSGFDGGSFPSPDTDDEEGYREILEVLQMLCTSRNIEVIFEEVSHPYYDSRPSPEFLRRCEVRKAADTGLVGKMKRMAL